MTLEENGTAAASPEATTDRRTPQSNKEAHPDCASVKLSADEA